MYVTVAFLVISPVVQFALQDPDTFWSRTKEASIFRDKTREQAWVAIKSNVQKHLLMFNYSGDRNGRHNLPGAPMLNPVVGALMILGLGLSLWRWRDPRFFCSCPCGY